MLVLRGDAQVDRSLVTQRNKIADFICVPLIFAGGIFGAECPTRISRQRKAGSGEFRKQTAARFLDGLDGKSRNTVRACERETANVLAGIRIRRKCGNRRQSMEVDPRRL